MPSESAAQDAFFRMRFNTEKKTDKKKTVQRTHENRKIKSIIYLKWNIETKK